MQSLVIEFGEKTLAAGDVFYAFELGGSGFCFLVLPSESLFIVYMERSGVSLYRKGYFGK